ncbi:MAG: hypothetical protein HONBIEJF_01410 [Fimbriimonadaceae bacterium]|nr:hypothetical protein [Fimbriimonadaceae bacterium]
MKRAAMMAIIACAGLATNAQDAWTATILRDSASSEARAISGDEQFGVFTMGACGWASSAASFTSYVPGSLTSSAINGAYAGVKGGFIATTGALRNAAVWTGGQADFQILEPYVFIASEVNAVGVDGPVGSMGFDSPLGDTTHARFWRNLTNAIDLHPANATMSIARGAADGVQVGEFRPTSANTTVRACLWRGSPDAFIDLSPNASNASAMAADGEMQAGFVDGHAARWHGTAESFVDLHPSGASESACLGARGVYQVGKAVFKGFSHAAIWSGTQPSFIDLHSALPAGYQESQANAVSTKLTRTSPSRYTYRIDVVGWARPTKSASRHAILWRLEGALTPAKGDKLPVRAARRIRAGRLANRRFVIDFSQPIREPIPRWITKRGR